MPDDATEPDLFHGTAVALDGRALLLRGRSGSGKSTLARELISRGAILVADDRVLVTPREAGLVASAPHRLAGLLEARGVGILQLAFTSAPIVAVIDMDSAESDRLPQRHDTVIAGETLAMLRKVESPAFPAMLIAYLKGGRREV